MKTATKILIVEQNRDDFLLIRNELEKCNCSHEIRIAETITTYLELLYSFKPQLILADIANPSPLSGLQAFAILQKIDTTATFVLICASVKEAYSFEPVRKGEMPYVAKNEMFTLNSKLESALQDAAKKQQDIQAQQQLDIVYNTIADIVFLIKVEGGRYKFISVNRAFLRFTGFGREQVLNAYADALVPLGCGHKCLQRYNEAASSKKVVTWEERLGPAGRTCRIRLTPLLNNAGQCTQLVGVAQEITDRQILIQSLEESNQRNMYVAKATFEAIWDWDIAANKVYWGDGYYNLFGKMSEDESNVDVIYLRIHPDDIRELLADAKAFLKKGNETNWQYEHRYLKANGEYAYVCNKAVVVRNAEGRALRVIGAMEDITQKKSLENALNSAIKVARFGTWELDLLRSTLYWSDMIREVFGTPDDYMPALETGLKFYKEGYSRDLITKKVKEAIEKGLSFDIEAEIVRPDEDVKWIRVLGNPEFENGVCIKVTGSMQDISARKMAELTVNQVLREQNIILESIADAFFAIDKNWIFTYWNNQAEKIFERTREEILGNNVWHLFPKRIGSKVHMEYKKCLEEGVVARFEDYNAELNKWFAISCYPSEKGGISVYLKEITARKLAELQMKALNESLQKQAAELEVYNKELTSSEKRFSDIFNLSPQPMWLFDEDTFHFVQVNEAAIRLYGYSEEEFMQMNLMDIKMPDDAAKLTSQIFQANEGDRTYSRVFNHRKKSGKKIEVEVYSNHMDINGKNIRSVIAIDVTEKNQQEYNIIKAIIKTQEDERYELGSELHDNVCQILSGSRLFLEMLKNEIPPAKTVFYQHCDDNIKLALDEARNLSHRLAPVFFEESTLEDAFNKMLENYRIGSSTCIEMHIDKQLNTKKITLDAKLNLYRILQEQIRNIFKYANATLVEIHTLLEDKVLIMTIADNGIGFNAAQVSSGIGFANMKRRAELFSGQLIVNSAPGKGCTIEVIIPVETIADL